MALLLWMIFSLIILGLILAVISFIMLKGEKMPADYYGMFIVGISIMPVSIIFQNFALLALGIVFMILGLKHRKEWKSRPVWKKMSPAQKKVRMIFMIFLGVVLLLGIVFFFLMQKGVL